MHSEYSQRGVKIIQSFEITGGIYSPQDSPELPKSRTFSVAEAIQDKIDSTRSAGRVEKTEEDESGRRYVFLTTTYDRDGNEVEEVINHQSSEELRTITTFDRNGWIVERTVYKNGKVEIADRYSYEVDDHGNWVKSHHTCFLGEYPNNGVSPLKTLSARSPTTSADRTRGLTRCRMPFETRLYYWFRSMEVHRCECFAIHYPHKLADNYARH